MMLHIRLMVAVGIKTFKTLEVSGNVVKLDNKYNCYKLKPTSTLNLTFDNSEVKQERGGEFYLMIDLSDGVKTINFPDTFKWKNNTTKPTINAQNLYIFKCMYLYTDPIAYTGEFITSVVNKDYDGIVVYGFSDPGDNYWDNPEATITKPIIGFDGVNYINEITLTGRDDLMYYGEQCTPCLNDTDIFVTSIKVGPNGKIGKISVDSDNEVNSEIIVNGGTINSIVGGSYEMWSSYITLNSGYIGMLNLDNYSITMYDGLIDDMYFYQSKFSIYGGEVKQLTRRIGCIPDSSLVHQTHK
jgi:hypothetical protein